MISSFFSRTKPINYLVILGVAAVLYLVSVFFFVEDTFDGITFFAKLGVLVVLVLSLFFINPTLKANKLAELSSFTMLFYVLLTMAFLPILKYDTTIIGNFLLLLSIDKVLSLKEEKRTKYKIFEASLLVFASSILNEWTLVFLIPIYLGIYAYGGTQVRNWIMPLAAFTAIFLMAYAYASFFGIDDFFTDHYQFKGNRPFAITNYYGIGFYTLCTLAIAAVVLVKLANRGVGRIVSLRIVLSYFVLGIVLVFLSDNPDMNGVMFTFFATAVLLTNYVETIKKKRFKETFLIFLILVSFTFAVIHLYR